MKILNFDTIKDKLKSDKYVSLNMPYANIMIYVKE